MAEAENLISFTKTIALTSVPEAITTVSKVITGVAVKAATTNAAVVEIGPSTVGATSYPLEQGEVIGFDLIDPSRIFIFGTAGDQVFVVGLSVQ